MKKILVSVAVIGLIVVGAYAKTESSNKYDKATYHYWYGLCVEGRGKIEYCKCEAKCLVENLKKNEDDDYNLAVALVCMSDCVNKTGK